MLVSSGGGDYSNQIISNVEMGERYIKTIFTFFGIADFKSISPENLDVQGIDVNGILDKAKKELKRIAKKLDE